VTRFLGLLLATALAAPAVLHAESFLGTVTYVTDGDTLWVRPSGGGAAVQIRLLDLDAPEACQTFGVEAAEALRSRVLQRPVRVRTRGTDDYGRVLAHVQQGREDIGAWLVRDGYAWSSTFHGKPGPYSRLQAQARSENRGLWSLSDAVEPRTFRHHFGHCR
jgi:endonuclease YncB( thermonuclease family)